MCANCFTNVEAAAINVAVGAVLLRNAWEKHADRRDGITPIEREQRTWLRNASFMQELDLDPIEILGPPPGVDVPLPTVADVAAGVAPSSAG